MKATEMLNKIKTFLGEETADIVNDVETQETVELAQAKLDNDTVIEAESFEAGKEVFIITEDEKVALPVGEYTMEDGKILVVEEEGVIAEIKDAESEEVEAEEEEMGYVTKEELAEAVSEIKAMIEDLKKEEMSEEVETTNVEETELSEVSEELSEPAAEPIAHNPEQKNNFNVKFAQNRKQTTFDKVLSKINN